MRIKSIFTHSAQAIAEGALISLLVVGLIAGTAFAAKPAASTGGHHKGGGTGTTYTGTLGGPRMVVDNNGDGSANYGDQITFNVTSTAPYPFVRVSCSQNGILVWDTTQGFYTGWLWGTEYKLNGAMWNGGAADCTAVLYSQSSSGTVEPTEATLSFRVNG